MTVHEQTCAAVLVLWAGVVDRAPAEDLALRLDALCARGVHVGVIGRVARLGFRDRATGPGRSWIIDTGAGSSGATAVEDATGCLLGRLGDLGVGPGLVLVLGRPGDRRPPLDVLDRQLARIAHGRVPDIDRDPRWIVRRDGPAEGQRRVDEALFTLSGGGVGTRGAVEEDVDGRQPMVLAAGVYRGLGPSDGLLAGPSWTDVPLRRPPGLDTRMLDLRTGVLLREQVAADGPPVRSLRFASVAQPRVGALRLEAPVSDLALLPGEQDESWTCRTGETTGGIGVLVRRSSGAHGGLATWQALAAVDPDPRGAPDRDRARAGLDAAAGIGFDGLLVAQREEWARRWATAGVSLPDDPELELGLRFALFHLRSLEPGDGELAIGARGLSGCGYAGHVFWDADVFVLPALMTVEPAAAEAMVRYRTARLGAARERAAALGFAGARFPWESAATGDDVTPTSGSLGAEKVPIYTGAREEHVTADVAWAVVRQASWAGRGLRADEEELLAATATYWASRMSVEAAGRAHLRGVIGPDEYHEDVDDNAFTNVLARWNLRAAAALATGVPDATRRSWSRLAEAVVDGYDATTGRHEQFEGYADLEPLTVDHLGRVPVAADVLLGRHRVARSQLIKQPDVLMVHMMVPDEVAPGSLGPDLDHYLPRTAHGSSLSPAATALVMARAGRTGQARELLLSALGIDLDDVAGTTAEGLHLGAMGGAWQAFLFGFVGAEVVGTTLRLDPRLPPTWQRVEVRFRCLSSDVRLLVRAGEVALSSSRPVRAACADGPVIEVAGDGVLTVLPRGPA